MKNLKEQKGITLVALVVTIIVLLILAGVTILYVMSDNGIFGQAESASTSTNTAYVKEVLLQAILEAQAEHYDPAGTEATDKAAALTFVKAKLATAGITDGETPLACTAFCDATAGTVFSGGLKYQEQEYTVNIDTAAGTSSVTAKVTGD